MANSDLVQSLSRGLDLLQLIGSRPEGMWLNDLAEASGLKKTTAHNLLRTLCARGFVANDRLGRYSIGPCFFELSEKMNAAERLADASVKMLEFSKRFPDHVITFSTLRGGEVTCVLRVSPDMPDMVQRPASRHYMPYSSASAIVLQAANPREAQLVEALYPFDEYGAGIWGNSSDFAKVCADVLRERYYIRIRSGNIVVAFIMPDCYTLAFRARCNTSASVEPYRQAAEEFRCWVWGA